MTFIKESASKLAAATKDLSEKLDVFPSTLASIDKKIDRTHELLLQGVQPSEKEEQRLESDSVSFEWTPQTVNDFYLDCPFSIMMCLYLITKANFKAIRIPQSAFGQQIRFITNDFFLGFVCVSKAVHLMSFEVAEGIYIITMVVAPLTENIDQWLNNLIQFHREKGNRTSVADYLENTRADIDCFLASVRDEK
jgi:hypothetical protein